MEPKSVGGTLQTDKTSKYDTHIFLSLQNLKLRDLWLGWSDIYVIFI